MSYARKSRLKTPFSSKRSATPRSTDLTWWHIGHAGSTWLRSSVWKPINSTSKPTCRRSPPVTSKWPELPENTVLGDGRLHARARHWRCHHDPVRQNCSDLPIVVYSGKPVCCFTRLIHFSHLALGRVSFDAVALPRPYESCRWDHPVLPRVLGRQPDSCCCATLNGKQTGTKGHDSRRSPTSQ
jgi:hypothetical protein